MRKLVAFAVVMAAVIGWQAAAQERSLRGERTVDYRTGRAAEIKATVGPIRVDSVEFSDMGTGYGRGGSPGNISGRLRGEVPDSQASTTIRARFVAENPTAEEWEVAFTLEFLDRSGAVIDKVTKRQTWEGEAKPYNFDHPMLTYVVPMISRVRISMVARLD